MKQQFTILFFLLFVGAMACTTGGRVRPEEKTEKEPMTEDTLQLPKPDFRGIPLEDALRARRSVREYSSRPLTRAQLGQLLFSAQGITGSSHGKSVRTAPSAGGTFPMEMLVAVRQVEGLSPGVYRYLPRSHVLAPLARGDVSRPLWIACLRQPWVEQAAVVLVITAVPERIRPRYRDRSERYIHMEAGHIAQNIHLQAVSLGLGSVPVGAFDDEAVHRILGLEPTVEQAIYLIPVGVPL